VNRYRWDPVSPVTGRRPVSDLRASDAERHVVGDALARHFAEGRLDQAEFSARLDRAMGAVTRGELDGLFHDLPPLDGQATAPRRRRPRLLALLVVAVLAAMALGTVASTFHLPWALLVLGAALLWYRARRHRRRDPAAVGPAR